MVGAVPFKKSACGQVVEIQSHFIIAPSLCGSMGKIGGGKSMV
ncbi:hypothetical protein FTUN_0215 [Frigoriglobus tundricola]|uniref:Uncharacterized protein n=1 Tax=Frigoriglobus tundricola TaxID=2774151 RepID=A0A6M5YFG3_9BACT|nr:hypothetical protein FTUN_0215 [Frigoriglobus tundricola]